MATTSRRWVQPVVAAVMTLFAYWIGIRTGVNVLAPALAHAAPTSSIKLDDPWGQVGSEMHIQAVTVGGLECAVLTSREGAARRTSLWCK